MNDTLEDRQEEAARRLLVDADKEKTDRFFREYAGLAQSTTRTYRAAWNDFGAWCRSEDRSLLPASSNTVAAYLRSREHLALSTIRSRLSALSYVHRHLGFADPTGGEEAAEVRRKIAVEKRKEESSSVSESAGLSSRLPTEIVNGGLELLKDRFDQLREKRVDDSAQSPLLRWRENRDQIISTWSDPLVNETVGSASRITEAQKEIIPDIAFDLSIIRDRAILLLMACSGVNRAELVRTDFVDVVAYEESITVGIRKKNGMPDRSIRLFEEDPVEFCPTRAIAAWCVAAGLEGGPLFRSFDAHRNLKSTRISSSSVNLVVEKAAERGGLEVGEWTPGRLSQAPDQ